MHRLGAGALVAGLLLAAVSFNSASAQTSTATVTTRDGKEYRGRVVTEAGESVTLIGSDSVEVKVPRSQIRAITYGDASADRPATTPATEAAATPPPPPEKTSFPVLGVALGTPAGINAIVGYYVDGWGVRMSGMYLSRVNGVEFELLRNIDHKGNFSHNFHIGAGMMYVFIPGDLFTLDETYRWRYFSFGYDFNWNSFHLSSGLSIGSGDFRSPQLTLQLGYVKEFR